MSDFDDKSGVVECKTEWGSWWQTMDEVYIQVNVTEGTSSKEIKCVIKPRSIKLEVRGNIIINGDFPFAVHADESLWTLEDKKLIRVCLPKSISGADKCWKSLLVGQYEADPFTFLNMEKKLTLQRFQYENPGMDFSNADISGNFKGGGPQFPSYN